MGVYLVNFLVYSMAMVGVIFACLMVYKKTMVNHKCLKDNQELTVENALNLSQRKTIYIIKAGSEKFLIASDAERTTFLSKLNSDVVASKKVSDVDTSSVLSSLKEEACNKEPMVNIAVDYSEVMSAIKRKRTDNKNKPPVMREMLRKLSEPVLKD